MKNVAQKELVLEHVTNAGADAVKRVSDSLKNGTSKNLDLDAENVLARHISATASSARAEVLLSRFKTNRLK